MKIEGFDPLSPAGGPEKKKGTTGASGDFARMLDALAGSGTSSTQGAGSLSSLGPLSQVPFLLDQPSAGSAQSAAVMTVDNLLTDLDMLANAFGNESMPLARLQPLVDSLFQKKDDIASLIGKVDDPQLRSVLSDAFSLVVDQVDLYHSLR